MYHTVFSHFLHLTYTHLLRPILFQIDPERVHDRTLGLGHKFGQSKTARNVIRTCLSYQHPILTQTIAGIEFKNPVGLSEGFDKDGYLAEFLPAIGFGFTQVGTVTLKPYEGNPRPRLTRLPKSKAILVNYGLKNEGVEAIMNRLKKLTSHPIPLGISIGKTNSNDTTTTETGIKDYKECLKKVIESRVGDLYTINISCPNTFGGEPFTTAERLDLLLTSLQALNIQKPLFIKMPINLPWPEFQGLLDICLNHKVTGVIIGNLNKDHTYGRGGLSGLPTKDLSNELISKTHDYCGQKLVIIGVGGIFSADDAYEKIKRGASLVQLITGLIYEGPQIVGEINRGLVKLLQRDGYDSISQAIGSDLVL